MVEKDVEDRRGVKKVIKLLMNEKVEKYIKRVGRKDREGRVGVYV
jgi:superfamily II DNA/RNA helicase